MNNKLLISVSLPILDISFDLEVPNIIKVGSLKNIILDYVRNNYNNDMNLGTFRLIKRESGTELDSNLLIKEILKRISSNIGPMIPEAKILTIKGRLT